MNETEKQFEEVSENFHKPLSGKDEPKPLEPVTFQVGEVLELKERRMRIVRITKHCIVLTPLGWEVDIGEASEATHQRE